MKSVKCLLGDTKNYVVIRKSGLIRMMVEDHASVFIFTDSYMHTGQVIEPHAQFLYTL